MSYIRYVFERAKMLHQAQVDEAGVMQIVQTAIIDQAGVARIIGTMKLPAVTVDEALEYEQTFCAWLRAHGVKLAYGLCPQPLAEHYAATYPGWHINGDQDGLVRIEKRLEEP